jgi:hypothetical protein
MVDGARPDVQLLFPTVPHASQAGWGYLMLTNFLPGLGNGTFRLSAIAEDAEGHSVLLGTKTITCANAAAINPFGAIDTPAQGATIGGNNYLNFGWVLSPGSRRSDPAGGGTVRVVIDGAIGGQPGAWGSRSDLTALFPVAQFSGIGTALGVAALDTTALTNGVHTIAWLVTDNLGAMSGIGSRFFTVSNGVPAFETAPDITARTRATTIAGAAAAIDTDALLATQVNAIPADSRAIHGRRGFALDTPLHAYAIRDARTIVQAEELDRIELHLGAIPGQRFTGHLRVGRGLVPLPAGSALNASTGEFTWAPGVGFVGAYDLVFVRWSGELPLARHDVRVVLNAKGSARVGPQTVIDMPARGSEMTGPFLVAGWAADLDEAFGAGIDAVHVWAYPTAGGDPIWIGAAAWGGTRPDVAAIHGDRFLRTGYGIVAQGLAPGTYDVAVFAHSTVSGQFAPARTVRITVR